MWWTLVKFVNWYKTIWIINRIWTNMHAYFRFTNQHYKCYVHHLQKNPKNPNICDTICYISFINGCFFLSAILQNPCIVWFTASVCDLNVFLKYFVARPMMTSSKRHPTRTHHRGLLPSRGDSKSCKASCWLWWPSSSPLLSDSASSSLGDKQMLRSSNTKEGRKCFI